MSIPRNLSFLAEGASSTGVLAVTNGGTGVTVSSGASSVALRDSSANITANYFYAGFSNTAAAGTTTTLTAASVFNYVVTGSGGQTFKLPDATTLSAGAVYIFNNNQSSGTIVVQNNSTTTVVTIQSGGVVYLTLLTNSIAAGTWDTHYGTPSNASWSTNTLSWAGSITSATWNGVAVGVAYGGTGVTTSTGTGSVVLSNTPTLVTPVLGVASATTINKVTLTAPATGSTLTVADGKTLTASNSITLAGTDSTTMTFPAASATVAGLGTTQTFTGTQSLTGSSSILAAVITNIAEPTTVSATAATGTIALYPSTQSILYYTSNASANWTTNITFSSGTTMNTAMSTGQTMTVTFWVTQGSTAYYNNLVWVDGAVTGVTTKWLGGAPTAGNASGIDVYTYSVTKTASATFTVLATVSQFK